MSDPEYVELPTRSGRPPTNNEWASGREIGCDDVAECLAMIQRMDARLERMYAVSSSIKAAVMGVK